MFKRFRRVGLVLILGGLFLPSFSSGSGSTRLFTSASFRNASVQPNSFDFQIAGGYGYRGKSFSFSNEYQHERQDGVFYNDYEQDINYKRPAFGIGLRMVDSEEADMYLMNLHAEYRRTLGPFSIGGGSTVNFADRWFSDGAVLARFSADANTRIKLGDVTAIEWVAKGVFEVNETRQRLFAMSELRGLGAGLVAFIPEFKIERIVSDGTPTKSKWHAKLKAELELF